MKSKQKSTTMRRTLSFMVMAFALLFAQCRKPEVKFPTPSAADEGTTVSMTVTAGPGSKTDITTAGGITWSTGDKLYVGFGGEYVGCLTLMSGQNTPTGWFSGNVTLPNGTTGDRMFDFFYLGNAKDYSEKLEEGTSTTVDVSFATQEIYADANSKLANASKYHVGYGSAKGTVAGSEVTGINVTLVSKVALARFSFTKGGTGYSNALTLSGDNIYNSMTVNFGGTFTGKTKGDISLTGGYGERYVMLVPVGTGSETLSFAGDGFEGSTTLGSGIEANKFYGREAAIAVTLHEYVDLGLPSGLLWATCNLGAEHPYDYGDYYAWGEILPYYADGHSQDVECTHWREDMTTGAGNTDITNGYHWKTYSKGGSNSFVEWTIKPYGGDNILTSACDAATKNWGSDWRMPTSAEFTELINNTDRSWTTENGVDGWKCANKLDASKYIFLPAAGCRGGTSLTWPGIYGRYWSSTLYSESKPYNGRMWSLGSGDFNWQMYNRNYGCSVRPVCPPQN